MSDFSPAFLLNDLDQPVGLPVPDWQGAISPVRTTVMEGRSCRLEGLDPDRHSEDLFQAVSEDGDGRNWTYLPYGPFARLDAYREWLSGMAAEGDPMFFTIVDLGTGRAVGVASFLRIAPRQGVIEVGHIHFSPLLQRRPTATEAMYLMMRHVFEDLGYRRYEWKCDALNDRSCRAARRLGFSYEGTFRQAAVIKGRNRDTAWYSMLDSEWPARKTALESWLSPENFDDQGRQRRTLAEIQDQA